ncbi:MAG: glycosyltransferase family 2 protein [Planctomycetota bacterium]
MKLVKDLKGNKKIVIVMPAYNAAETLAATLAGIPDWCYDEIILVDDGSTDKTVELARQSAIHKVIVRDKNGGYGANQKTCYGAALEAGADIVVLLHPDNQYNPAIIPNMVFPILLDQADVVFASRFIQDPVKGGALAGGMPLLKFVVNKALTFTQNLLMGSHFSEFHTGYRAYTKEVLRRLDISQLSDDFVFDNQIIAPMVELKLRICQIGVETRYFAEASSISLLRGMRYAWGCLGVGLNYFLHRKNIQSWDLLERVIRPKID